MNRRAFLNSIPVSVFLAAAWPSKTAASNRVGYDPEVCTAMEMVMSKQTQQMGFERDTEQRNNLRIAFNEVKPISFTDLAFVVWCGERHTSVADIANEYHSRRENGVLAKDYYPYVSMQNMAVPDSRGLYVFKEEFSVLVQESLDILSRREASEIACQMYARPRRSRKVINNDNFQDNFGDLFSAGTFERVGLDKLYNLFVFINREYGKASSFTYCATIADRACNA